ncbi:MAG: hypothetical protein WBD73_16485, partial [Candidatus Acidiferrales bacterium]
MNEALRTRFDQFPDLVAVPWTGFQQGQDEKFDAPLLQFTIEHTSRQYTLGNAIVKRNLANLSHSSRANALRLPSLPFLAATEVMRA